MRKILVAYASRSGSTVEVAQAIASVLTRYGASVETVPVDSYIYLPRYDAVVVGGLLYRTGWHASIVDFLWKNQKMLSTKPVAYFATGLGLTFLDGGNACENPLFIDPGIRMLTKDPARFSRVEKYMSFEHYMQTALKLAPSIHPISIAFFAGKLDFKKLNISEKLIMQMLLWLTGRKAGDHRNWEVIDTWAEMIAPRMVAEDRVAVAMPVNEMA
jgi:menaquinone-dependent protoporphyrinogen oxidase